MFCALINWFWNNIFFDTPEPIYSIVLYLFEDIFGCPV